MEGGEITMRKLSHQMQKSYSQIFIRYSIYILTFFGFVISGCVPQSQPKVSNNKIDILEKRIIALEQQELKTLADLREEVETFKKKVKRDLDSYRSSQQLFIDELNRLKSDMEIITNENEFNQNRIRKNAVRLKQLNKRLGDQVIALQELQQFFNSGVNDNTGKPQRQEQTEFNTALQLYKKRQFKKAELAFKKYRRVYPESDLVDDSLYYIGYMYFLQGDYSTASLRLFEMTKQFPKSNRVNDAKWWLGVSLERSGDLNGALDIYRELTKLAPNDPLRIKAEFRLEELSP